MNSEGHIYPVPPQATLDQLDTSARARVDADVERLRNFAEKPLDEQLEEWRETIAKRQAERARKAT